MSPCLGSSFYTVRTTTGSAYLDVDTYGKVQTFQNDFRVTYDAFADSFDPSEADMHDNPVGLQPTPPRNFTCTNAGQTWQHPHFTWRAPEAPEGVNFTYKIYRKGETPSWDEVASDLTVTEWTDREVVINPSGRRYWYRATANSGQSPESEPSNEVSVNGYLGKPVAEGTGNSELEGGHVRLGGYPNPFNISATICYSVPAPGEVSLILCDVEGRQLRRLVEAHQSAGGYHLAMDGGALPSGLYLLRLLWGGQSLSRKVLLVR
ncbi:MAG: hypothetical protein H5U38_00130 [Calditrichaeota bacterium]|nr:hypothetical protein [Calditrichota bacterium]